MPLSKARMRERKRRDRVKPKSNLTPITSVKPKSIPGLIIEGNRIVGVKPKQVGQDRDVQPKLYNPAIHKPGDTVLIQRGNKLVSIVVPELDGDGQPIPEFT